MASVSSTFAGLGNSTSIYVPRGYTFRLSISGTWVATVNVQESNNGQIAWAQVNTMTTNSPNDYPAKTYNRYVRLACTAYTSGTVTYVISNVTSTLGPVKYLTVPVGSVAYGSFGTNTTPSTTAEYQVPITITYPFTATGMAVLNGGTAATDKYVLILRDSTGKLITNTATAGVVASGTDAFQEIAFPSPIVLAPGTYLFCLQVNGTTTRFRSVAASTFPIIAGSVTSVFGTVADTITPVATFTADKAPVGYIY